MSRNSSGGRFLLVSLALVVPIHAACSESGDGSSGGGDPVNSTRVELLDEGNVGGAAGAGGASPTEPEPIRVCTPDVIILDGLPECFVAEVSAKPLDCTLPGHEELRPEWERAARERECAHRDILGADCGALSLCGIAKATGSALLSCEAGGAEAPPGYCAVNERSDGCAQAEEDSLFVYGVNPDAEALHISCAIVDD